MRKHRARQAAETWLLKYKKEVVEALSEGLGLREAARWFSNLTPFPVNRFMAKLMPPIEGYIQKINEAAKRQSSLKGNEVSMKEELLAFFLQFCPFIINSTLQFCPFINSTQLVYIR
ncbi:unnamed protein product [Lactuca virosa]|uniref:Uncharacterized protein n=1 Tax=Lactuca virosa TaxID=75947 RepID=A0AAU9M7Z3_9ASTR|nr:unnamed protein product [Lactuca virosa]